MKRLLVMGAVIGLSISSAPGASARSLFEDFAATFFGAPSRPTAYYYVPEREYAPLEMTVRKRQPRKTKAVALPQVSSKPSAPALKLDPATDPDWYLKDPTLRRGDIVVTGKGVLVYNGRRGDDLRRTDFASLGGKSGGAAWQQQLKAAAAGGRAYFADDVAPPSNLQATAQ